MQEVQEEGTTQGSTTLTTMSASASLNCHPGPLRGLGHDSLCHFSCIFLSSSFLFSLTLLLLLFHSLCSTIGAISTVQLPELGLLVLLLFTDSFSTLPFLGLGPITSESYTPPFPSAQLKHSYLSLYFWDVFA